MNTKTLDQHIECTAGVLGGKPRIAGRRISVQDIVVWHERMGKGPDEIAAEYDLTLADVHAALAYYFDHREEIDKSLHDDDAWIEAMKQQNLSVVKQKLRDKGLPADGGQDQVLSVGL